jgi:hypothetical protein
MREERKQEIVERLMTQIQGVPFDFARKRYPPGERRPLSDFFPIFKSE